MTIDKGVVGAIINLNESLFDIVSTNESERLVKIDQVGSMNSKYKEFKDTIYENNLRGLLVDIDEGVVVHLGQPVNAELVATSIVSTDENDDDKENFYKIDDEGVLNISNKFNYKLYTGFEGLTITAFLHKGVVYKSPPLKLSPKKSWWGSSPLFSDIINTLNFPSDETLYDVDKQYSPYVHRFILVHPSLLNVSKCPVGLEGGCKGFIVYIGYETRDLDYIDEEQIDYNLWQPPVQYDLSSIMCWKGEPVDCPIYFEKEGIDVSVANDFLKWGYHKQIEDENITQHDKRVGPGEFVIMKVKSESDQHPSRWYRIHSPSYDWRMSMMKNNKGVDNPVHDHQLHQLLHNKNFVLSDDYTIKMYLDKFPWLLGTKDIDYFQTEAKRTNFKGYVKWNESHLLDENKLSNTSIYDRVMNIALCFIFSLPLSHQQSGFESYKNYINNIHHLRTSMRNAAYDQKLFDELSDRMKALLTYSIETTKSLLNHPASCRLSNTPRVRSKLGDQIKMVLSKEGGPSLYREMKTFKFVEQYKDLVERT